MARCPFATWKPLPQNFRQAIITPTQVIFHSLTSTDIDSSWAYFAGPNASGTESHFLLAYDGRLVQAMDTAVRADAQWDANAHAISIETASNSGATDPWTPAQAAMLERLGTWLMTVHTGIKPVQCPAWDASGFGYHRLFDQWNYSHHSCPGNLRVKQFPMILDAIAHPVAPAEPKPPVTIPKPPPVIDSQERDTMLVSTQFKGVANPSFWVLHAGNLVNVHPVVPKVDLAITDEADWARMVSKWPAVTTP